MRRRPIATPFASWRSRLAQRRGREPTWLSRLVLDAIHLAQLREHGGLPGVRDENALESALARPRQQWHYSDRTDVPSLAAAYAFGLVQNHPYCDGNKRVGFLAMVTFLGVNGHQFAATEAEVVTEMLALADGRVSAEALSEWVRQHCSKVRRG
jgi:death on curing protein